MANVKQQQIEWAYQCNIIEKLFQYKTRLRHYVLFTETTIKDYKVLLDYSDIQKHTVNALDPWYRHSE